MVSLIGLYLNRNCTPATSTKKNQDVASFGSINLYPELSLSYYLEDHLRLTAEIGYSMDIDIGYFDPLEISFDHSIDLYLSTRWYLF